MCKKIINFLLRPMHCKLYALLFLITLACVPGCGDKIARLKEKLTRTIEEGGKGRIKRNIEYRVGYPVKIYRIDIKPTYKDDYTYAGIVTFRKRDIVEERKSASLPKLGALPATNTRTQQFQVRFRYLEEEDRWYLERYL